MTYVPWIATYLHKKKTAQESGIFKTKGNPVTAYMVRTMKNIFLKCNKKINWDGIAELANEVGGTVPI